MESDDYDGRDGVLSAIKPIFEITASFLNITELLTIRNLRCR